MGSLRSYTKGMPSGDKYHLTDRMTMKGNYPIPILSSCKDLPNVDITKVPYRMIVYNTIIYNGILPIS